MDKLLEPDCSHSTFTRIVRVLLDLLAGGVYRPEVMQTRICVCAGMVVTEIM